ncbi:MAG: hypothetical protein HN919_17175 [Verrucomicrobia bacterium]|jgi:hypothetical protein|nr:hypothetical protein [Verrucomicrobiota bacterium]MBT7068034.1 hypothetical protein [Verrucomicrobiota bacterium]MBT7699163.1 hypothetical protein [Verrucomicrobiota bacterium]
MRRVLLLMGLVVAFTPMAPAFDTWYVSTNSASDGPGTSWMNAFHSIQEAVDGAGADDLVLVTNGVYNSGGAVASVYDLTNRVCITNGITVRSVNGPTQTFIIGAADPIGTNGTAAIRCASIASNCVLSGFALTNGHTMGATGSSPDETSGGGAFLDRGGTLSNCHVRACNALQYGGGD